MCRSVVLALPLILLFAGWSDAEPEVELVTPMGSTVRATLLSTTIRIETRRGVVELTAASLRSLTLGDTDSADSPEGTCSGILIGELWLRTEFGDVTLTRNRIATLRMIVPLAKSPTDAAGVDLAPTSVVRLSSTIAEMTLSPDRAWLYLLNSSDGAICRVDTKTCVLDSAICRLGGGVAGMCLSPDGATIYAFSDPPYESFRPGAGLRACGGFVHVIESATMRVRSSIQLEVVPKGIAADDRGMVFIPGYPQGFGDAPATATSPVDFLVLDGTSRNIVLRTHLGWSTVAPTLLHPDHKRIYGPTSCISLPADARTTPEYTLYPELGEGRGPSSISPDGRYLISGGTGKILRLAKNRRDDMKSCAAVKPHLAAAWDEGLPWMVVSTLDGQLHVYTYQGFEPRVSFNLGAPAYRMLLDLRNNALYCAMDRGTRNFRGHGQLPAAAGAGDLHVYSLASLQ